MNLQEINNRILEIENSYQKGNIALVDAERNVSEILKNYHGEDRVIPLELYQIPEEDEKNSFFSGIKKLDDIFGRFHKGDIFTITAPTGQGKSAFARELFVRFSSQDKKCLYFAYEDTNYWFIRKLGKNLPKGFIPLMLNEKSLTWIEARVLESILKFGVEVIFIDNLKSITEYLSKNVNNSIEYTMQKIKEIAMKYNVMIFLCAHVKKERTDIDINSIKDSSAVADISSLVIALKREMINNEGSGITFFSVIKNRNNGMLKNFSMKFVPEDASDSQNVAGSFDEDSSGLEKLVAETQQDLNFLQT